MVSMSFCDHFHFNIKVALSFLYVREICTGWIWGDPASAWFRLILVAVLSLKSHFDGIDNIRSGFTDTFKMLHDHL
jgi:hypothetical protein